MKKNISIQSATFSLFLLSSISAVKAQDQSLTEIYGLSNNMMEVVTASEKFADERNFQLTTSEADIVSNIAKVDEMVGDYLAFNLDELKLNAKKDQEKDCPKVMTKNEVKKFVDLEDAFQKRKFQVGAYAIYSSNNYDKNAVLDFRKGTYNGFMKEQGIAVNAFSKMSWDNVVKDSGVNDSDSLEEKIKKIKNLVKTGSNLELPEGLIASEFAKKELLDKPNSWESTLKEASKYMDFDQKMNLVADLGGRMGNDYNYDRLKESHPESKGFVGIEKLLTNLNNNLSGGVCRDISLAQTQMLKTMGIKDAYSVAYLSTGGGHATVIARDPNNSNKVIKFNYGEIYEDDASKGSAVLDQDSTLPSVGMHYRIFDADGKPVASVPTELTKVLQDTIGKGNPFSSKSHNLAKAEFGTDDFKGSLFVGRTSTGEEIKGIALYNKSQQGGLYAETAGAIFNRKADKTFYELESNGVYLFSDVGYEHKILNTKNVTASGGIGTEIEMMFINTDSTAKKTGNTATSGFKSDSNIKPYVQSKVDYQIAGDKKIEMGAKVSGRIAKANVADEGTQGLHYDSTVISSKYHQEISKDMNVAVEAALNLTRYGQSAAITASLVDGKTRYYVGGNVPLSYAPSFFGDQQKVAKAGVSTETKSGWVMALEYEKNFDSKNNFIGGKAMKKF